MSPGVTEIEHRSPQSAGHYGGTGTPSAGFQRLAFILFPLCAVAAAAAVRVALDHYLHDHAPFLAFPLAVVVVALYRGLWPGLFATALSAFVGLYLFVEPRATFTWEYPGKLSRVVFFAGVGTAVTLVANQIRRSKLAAQRSERRYRRIVETATEGIWIMDAQGCITFANPRIAAMLGYGVEEMMGRPGMDFLFEDDRTPASSKFMHGAGESTACDFRLCHRNGSEIWTLLSVSVINDHISRLEGVLGMFTDITARRNAEAAVRQQARVLDVSREPILAWNADGTIRFWNRGAELLYGWSREEALGCIVHDLLRTVHPEPRPHIERNVRENGSWVGELVHTVRDGRRIVVESRWEIVHEPDSIPLVLETNRDITDRKQAEQEIQRQLRRLRSLRTIDLAILGATDVRLALKTVVEETRACLQADMAIAYVLAEQSLMLEPAAVVGNANVNATGVSIRVGEGISGKAALERRTIAVTRCAVSETARGLQADLAAEGVEALYATPLIAKGKLIGVLSVMFRTPFAAHQDWVGFYEMLAGQAAMAIDSGRAFEDLQRANLELRLAYDATIEGWSHAMDLRDRETEGHTQRVTDMTVELARAAGLPEEEIVHVRRGALLHDIGKIAVPDCILRKEGKLTEDEWAVMRQHPQHAYDMLSSIRYLRPALDIPYCHHEKWDGSGYPRGLKGEQIPLSARLFTVVDVWDALRSDRPYRQCWPEEQVLEHLRRSAGTHLDPRAVGLFVEFIKSAAPKRLC